MSEPIDDKMQLAVNDAMQELQQQRARNAIAGRMGIDSKRPCAWSEYGFPEKIEFSDFYSLYSRGGVAHGAVTKLADKCWHTDPEVIEGDEEDNKEAATAWEKSNKPVFAGGKFWRDFKEADKRRLVGRYSGLVLRIADNQDWDMPVTRSARLEGMLPAWAGSLQVSEWDNNAVSATYGKPKMWQFTEQGVGGSAGRTVMIHPDRIFILGDYSNDAIGFLEPAFNAFVSLEKVEGGSGESFLKNAARQLSVEYDAEVDLSAIASAHGVQLSGLKELFNENARKLNTRSDTLMVTQGGRVNPLVVAVSDPTPTYNVNLQTVSAAVDIPTKILVGMQTGERASSEDQRYFNARCQARRKDLGYEIHELIGQLIRIKVIKPIAEYSIVWDDLTEPTLADKLANVKVMAEVNSTALGTSDPVFSVDEMREAAGYDKEDAPAPLPETPTGEDAPEGDIDGPT